MPESEISVVKERNKNAPSHLQKPRKIGNKTAEPYQARIADEIEAAIKSGKSGVVIVPTGGGKSLLATIAVEFSLSLQRPILAIHPDFSLLEQNFLAFSTLDNFAETPFSTFIAQNDKIGDGAHLRNSFNAPLILATMASLTNKLDDKTFRTDLTAFAKKGGLILLDEGHKAAAPRLSELLELAAEHGASGIELTATPFRTDGVDPLEPFGASIESDIIGVAEYNEVLLTGRIVPTQFDLAGAEFEEHLGAEAINRVESDFSALIAANKSIDQASQQTFSRYFRSDADEDKTIASLIVAAVIKIWSKRAPNKRLTMIHCDSTDFASRLAEALSSTPMPAGHPREGQPARVGYVVSGGIRVWEDGAELDTTEDLDWKRARARNELLKRARQGGFDVLVNINALGVGTDVPIVDLNILACQERSIGPLKQLSGRGERKYANKTHQSFVDIGASVLRVFNDIDAMRSGAPERCRRQIRALPHLIRSQFEQWFDKDPSLADQIAKRQREIVQRTGETFESIEDKPDETVSTVIGASLPAPKPIARGVLAASVWRKDSETKTYFAKTALFIDLVETGLAPNNPDPAFPTWLAATYDERRRAKQAFLCKTLDDARAFVAFAGIGDDTARSEKPASDAQHRCLAALRYKNPKPPRQIGPFLKPENLSHATAMISLQQDHLLQKLLRVACDRLAEKASSGSPAEHPLKAIVLDRPDRLPGARRDLLAAYCKTRKLLLQYGDVSYDDKPFPIVTFDQTVLPETIRYFTDAGADFRIFDTPVLVEKAKARLAPGVSENKIIAVIPEGCGDEWLRLKAGLKKKDLAESQKESAYRRQLERLSELDHFPSPERSFGIDVMATELSMANNPKLARNAPSPITRFIADCAGAIVDVRDVADKPLANTPDRLRLIIDPVRASETFAARTKADQARASANLEDAIRILENRPREKVWTPPAKTTQPKTNTFQDTQLPLATN